MKRAILALTTAFCLMGIIAANASHTAYYDSPNDNVRNFWNDGRANYYNNYPLYGDVESVVVEFYNVRDNQDELFVVDSLNFGKHGGVERSRCYTFNQEVDDQMDNNGLSYEVVVEYDERGGMTKYQSYDFGSLRDSMVIVHDYDNNRDVSTMYNFDGKEIYTNIEVYGEKGKKILDEVVYPSGTVNRELVEVIDGVEHIFYITNGHVVRHVFIETTYVGDSTIKIKHSKDCCSSQFTIYNSKGNVVEDYEMNASYTNYFSTKYKYDHMDRVVRIAYADNDGSFSTELYRYDDAGNMVCSMTLNGDGNVSNLVELTYDDRGNVVQYIEYDSTHSQTNKAIFHITYRD